MKTQFHFDEKDLPETTEQEKMEDSYNCHIFYDKKTDEWTVTIQMAGELITKMSHKNLAAAVLFSVVEWA